MGTDESYVEGSLEPLNVWLPHPTHLPTHPLAIEPSQPPLHSHEPLHVTLRLPPPSCSLQSLTPGHLLASVRNRTSARVQQINTFRLLIEEAGAEVAASLHHANSESQGGVGMSRRGGA